MPGRGSPRDRPRRGGAAYGLSRQFGADHAVAKVALFAVLGIGAWTVFVIRNAKIKQKLRATE